MTLKEASPKQRLWYLTRVWLASISGVLMYWALPILRGMLVDNTAFHLSDVGAYRVLSAVVLSFIAAFVSDGEHLPTTVAAKRRSIKQAFIEGLGILALLEKIAGSGGV